MPLKPLSYRHVKRKLEKAGFTIASQRGSHVKFVRYNSDGTQTAIVPYHREISVGLLRSILRQAGLTSNEFDEL
ncbi:MAG: type II toxin-antitoxin system HicA family toxin [Candidatus Poribacteria bacterium]|nr:type II toxin-antitoxin system HicA family toxin [Candidatus Poribacteria bacterium]